MFHIHSIHRPNSNWPQRSGTGGQSKALDPVHACKKQQTAMTHQLPNVFGYWFHFSTRSLNPSESPILHEFLKHLCLSFLLGDKLMSSGGTTGSDLGAKSSQGFKTLFKGQTPAAMYRELRLEAGHH